MRWNHPSSALERHAERHQSSLGKRSQVRHARSGPRASQACHACASAKAKCDNGIECKRCIRKLIPCLRSHQVVEETSIQHSDSHDNGQGTYLSAADPVPAPTVDQDQPETSVPSNDLVVTESVLGLDIDPSRPMLPLKSPSLRSSSIVPLKSLASFVGMIENQDSYAVYNASCVNPFNGETDPGTSRGNWDFSTYNLFDLGADMHFVSNDPPNAFSSSLPALNPGAAGSILSAASPTKSLMSRMNHSTSDSVYEAFQQSAGRWDPEQRHYRSAEESHLCLGRGAPTNMDILGPYDPKIFSESLPPGTRDHILAAIVRTCDQDNMAAAASAFPAADILDRLLKAFHARHATLTDSWIHTPSFRIAEARLELLIAAISLAAALSPSRPVQSFALAMQEFLVYQLWAVVSCTP